MIIMNLNKLKILILGLNDLGIEVVKNLILLALRVIFIWPNIIEKSDLISQKIIAYTGKYIPIDQWLFFDFFEVLENEEIIKNIVEEKKIINIINF